MIIAAAGAVLFLGLVAIAVVLSGDDDEQQVIGDPQPKAAHPTHFAYGPTPWDVEGARSSVITMRSSGPTLQLTPEQSIDLSPQAPDLALEWTKETKSGVTRLTGVGKWRGFETTAVWSFARGNPHSTFEINVDGVKGADLSEPFTAAWNLPAGDVRHVNAQLRVVPWVNEPTQLNGWTPTWIEWVGAQQTVSIHQGMYDLLEIVPRDGGQVGLNVTLASDSTRPRIAECAPESEVDVSGRWALTLGPQSPVVVSRWPEGAQAMIAAVFEDPSTHPDPLAAAGNPLDSEDAARRIRTVALGHSDKADPRHGNGGVLGVGMSATVELSPKLDEADRKELETSFKSTRLELAGEKTSVRLTRGDCEAIAGADSAVVVTGYQTYDGAYQNSMSSSAAAVQQGSTALTLAQLDGRRSTVTDQALGKLYIDRLLRERGGLFISIPLVASRNPLIPAGKDGLLAPERNGHWTIAEPLVYALGDLELRFETEAFLMAGIGETVRHWRSMRRMEVWPTPDGLEIWHPGDEPVEGATFIAVGAHDPTGSFLGGRDIRDARASAQTWFWGTIPANDKLQVGLGEAFAAPTAVEWVFQTSEDSSPSD